ncbi:MarR family transcriptional regulator [Curtobacterium sp. MCPF17_002]|jgi:DNA-binding MarR family transcriptional regulator|uniref:MarR family winged helix-turn-helix transcriptional regulator n=1 Tax=Curtobacterium sp. MCPF17_002 TaxID=2175645 RepID=UPI000DA8764F|nr:MarR family transcriptional regulator [Curtobacterium sp. MCPF17_002]WIB78173.1 MarR family transcriptional regulator [Curtobacterium sp. MCPF17_002]
MTDTAPALPQQRGQELPPAPVSPTVSVPEPTPDTDLAKLMTAFRVLQMQHARVLHHESHTRSLNATDTRFVFFLAAADGQGVTPKQAGEYLELTTGAMTSLIDRLEKRAHIERRPNPEDRRSILIHLTPSGAEVAKGIGAVYTSAFREVIAPDDRAQLAAAFDRLGTALDRHSRAVHDQATVAGLVP